MNKPKIQPLGPLILRRRDILLLLLPRQRIPSLIPTLIPPDIVILDPEQQENIKHVDGQQNLIPALVQREVILSVDVARNDAARLDKHVVESGGHGAGTDGVGVGGVPGDEDGVAVGVGEEAGEEPVADPGVDGREGDEGDEEGKHPDVGDGGDDRTFLEFLGDAGDDEQLEVLLVESFNGYGSGVGLTLTKNRN